MPLINRLFKSISVSFGSIFRFPNSWYPLLDLFALPHNFLVELVDGDDFGLLLYCTAEEVMEIQSIATIMVIDFAW